jgi:hypothetical protein
LRDGKYKGFFLDHYKLLDRLGYNSTNSYYAAEDLESGKAVVLSLQTPHRDSPEDVQYEVLTNPADSSLEFES